MLPVGHIPEKLRLLWVKVPIQLQLPPKMPPLKSSKPLATYLINSSPKLNARSKLKLVKVLGSLLSTEFKLERAGWSWVMVILLRDQFIPMVQLPGTKTIPLLGTPG